jgi:IPT/TIG domain
MAIHSADRPAFYNTPLFSSARNTNNVYRKRAACSQWIFLVVLIVFGSAAGAQNAPQITGVDPSSGKVNDTVTLSGSNLGKTSVSSVYLSDEKNDYKATIVNQSDEKITVKVPQVKPGDYNVSVEVGDKLFIKPLKFKVEQ